MIVGGATVIEAGAWMVVSVPHPATFVVGSAMVLIGTGSIYVGYAIITDQPELIQRGRK